MTHLLEPTEFDSKAFKGDAGCELRKPWIVRIRVAAKFNDQLAELGVGGEGGFGQLPRDAAGALGGDTCDLVSGVGGLGGGGEVEGGDVADVGGVPDAIFDRGGAVGVHGGAGEGGDVDAVGAGEPEERGHLVDHRLRRDLVEAVAVATWAGGRGEQFGPRRLGRSLIGISGCGRGCGGGTVVGCRRSRRC